MLGVVIGRFQTPYLTRGHTKLIDRAIEDNKKVLILVGVTAAQYTDRDPLTYKMREEMIKEYFKKIDYHSYKIEPLYDQPLSDKDWSKYVDEAIGWNLLPNKDAIIYGGRDNSIFDSYSGKHQICIILEVKSSSGTETRNRVKSEVDNHKSEDFRRGVIYSCHDRYPTAYGTVDVALISKSSRGDKSVLMGKKGDKLTFVGGFIDPSDESMYHTAVREVKEETGLVINPKLLRYETSKKINDKRYHKTKHGIMTTLFSYFDPKGFTIDESKITDKEFSKFVKVRLIETNIHRVMDEHIPLFQHLINNQ